MALFDRLQSLMHDTCNNIFGTTASWTPSTGGAVVTGLVLVKEPTVKQELSNDVSYMPQVVYAEYKKTDFVGLFEAVRANESEYITINNIEYYVRQVTAIYDGKTYKALLDPKL